MVELDRIEFTAFRKNVYHEGVQVYKQRHDEIPMPRSLDLSVGDVIIEYHENFVTHNTILKIWYDGDYHATILVDDAVEVYDTIWYMAHYAVLKRMMF